ncbi:hypothetical protein EVAR_83653_1 [Eumeta japonica]|uniref:Uncharacterized protein n=1 Tax=Eumeta variegata TaxID=151549 RepID=A0A4C1UPW7_EUMVA|nr:hypothetical protein EVAR_83653_1 [Eumeta japonica]
MCANGMAAEDMHYVVWECSLYDDLRKRLLDGLEVLRLGPVHYMELVRSRVNFSSVQALNRENRNIGTKFKLKKELIGSIKRPQVYPVQFQRFSLCDCKVGRAMGGRLGNHSSTATSVAGTPSEARSGDVCRQLPAAGGSSRRC